LKGNKKEEQTRCARMDWTGFAPKKQGRKGWGECLFGGMEKGVLELGGEYAGVWRNKRARLVLGLQVLAEN